jgi:hypothetical protein
MAVVPAVTPFSTRHLATQRLPTPILLGGVWLLMTVVAAAGRGNTVFRTIKMLAALAG